MPINGLPINHSVGQFAGLAATNAMALGGIKSGDNLLAVITTTAAGAANTHDTTDFTVGAGTITAGTIDLSGQNVCYAIWTSVAPT